MDKKRKARESASGHRARGFLREITDAVRGGLERLSAELDDDDSLDALVLLKAQHRYVERLFAQIQDANGDYKGRLFGDLADMLAVHATIEEKIFYPSVKTAATAELVHESAQEHLKMKRLLVELMETGVDDDSFDHKLLMLKAVIQHHAEDDEERKLFPIVRKTMDSGLLEALGGEMIALMVELQQNGSRPRDAIPNETAAPAPI
ncbi:MAG TPA: hemerythrin domain-containing protein [Polyangia bacterium]|jgi:hemerythrin superfamily protein|nr:hemerythrin domain-containing protein [Polyangia bacterium]